MVAACAMHAVLVRRNLVVDGDYLEENSDSLAVRISRTFVLSLACSIALLVGTTRLRGELGMPKLYWHWLPLIALVTCLVGSPLTVGTTRWRAVAGPILGLAAAWCLVPAWDTLVPGRHVYVPLLGIYFATLIWLYGTVGRRLVSREIVFALIATATAVSIGIAAVVSMKYGHLAAIVATGLAGCWAASWIFKLEENASIGLMWCAASMIGGIAFVGYVYPNPPVYELLLLPIHRPSCWFQRAGAKRAS